MGKSQVSFLFSKFRRPPPFSESELGRTPRQDVFVAAVGGQRYPHSGTSCRDLQLQGGTDCQSRTCPIRQSSTHTPPVVHPLIHSRPL